MRCTYQLGYMEQSQEEWVRAIDEVQAIGSLSGWLLRRGIIAEQGDRFVLLDPPQAGA